MEDPRKNREQRQIIEPREEIQEKGNFSDVIVDNLHEDSKKAPVLKTDKVEGTTVTAENGKGGNMVDLLPGVFVGESPPKEKGEFTSTKRGIMGLSPLPHRLDTLERVLRDSELRRVFKGKYKKQYEFVPHGEKTEGAAVGTIYVKKHSCGKNTRKKMKKWLGKVGLKVKWRHGTFEFTRSRDTQIKNERDHNLAVMLEYNANCLYRVLGDGNFDTPKNRLARLPLLNEYTKNYLTEKVLAKKFKLKNPFRIMSKWCDGYQNFKSMRVKTKEGEELNFIEYVRKYRAVPVKVIEPVSGKEIKLKGIMGLLAASTSIGDSDVLGRDGTNAGYVVQRNDQNEIISLNVVKVDPGYAFNYETVRGEKCQKFKDKRDIRYCPSDEEGIEWNKLTQEQKNEFLEVKIHHLEIIKSREILEYIFFREGLFNIQDRETFRMTKKVANQMIDELVAHIEREGKLYKSDIDEYKKGRDNFLLVNGKSDEENGEYDRSLCKFEKLLELLEARYQENEKDKIKILEVIGYVNGCISDVERFRGRYDRSLFFAKKSIKTLKKIPDCEVWRAYDSLGNVYRMMGEFDKSIESMNLKLSLLPKNHPHIASSYNILGGVYLRKGNYDKANEFFRLSLKMTPENHPNIAVIYNNLGIVCQEIREYDKAIEYYERSLKIRIASFPENHPVISDSYHNLGRFFHEKGEHERAIENYDLSLKIRLKTLPENHPDIATTYEGLGASYRKNKELEKAIEYFEMSLKMRLILLPENHPDLAKCYNNLGSVCQEKGELDKAIENLNLALKINLISLPVNHPDIARCYNNLGSACQENGELDKAIENLNLALKIRLKILPENHPDIATSYYVLGISFKRNGELEKAIDYFEMSLKMRLISLPENHPDIAGCYNNLGSTFIDIKEFDKAIKFFDLSLKIRLVSLPENHPDIAKSYYNLGLVCQEKGELDKAIEYLNLSLKINLISLPVNHPEIARCYTDLGSVCQENGELDKAIKYLVLALKINLISLPDNHPEIARCYTNLGAFCQEKGELDKAIENLNLALKINLMSSPVNHLNIAKSYNNLGIVYQEIEEHDMAIEYFESSLRISLKTLPENHLDIAASYYSLGITYLKNGELDKALEYFNLDLEINLISLPENHPSIASSYTGIGAVYLEMKKYDKANKYHDLSLKIRLKSLPENHVDIAANYKYLSAGFMGKKDYDRAIKYQELALKMFLALFPEKHPEIMTSYYNFSLIYQEKGEEDKANKYHELSVKQFGDELAKCVENQICTFKVTGEKFVYQICYSCITCDLVDGKGCCESCRWSCHVNHEVVEKLLWGFYCDCGSEGIVCKIVEKSFEKEK